MALSEWIGNKWKSIQKAALKGTLFAETVLPKRKKPVCVFRDCVFVKAQRGFRIYILFYIKNPLSHPHTFVQHTISSFLATN